MTKWDLPWVHHINKLKKTNHIIISIRYRKSMTTPNTIKYTIQNFRGLGIEGKFPLFDKEYL